MAILPRINQVRTFLRAARQGPPDLPADARARLRPGMEAQFRALGPGDQHHLLRVYRYLVAHGADEETVTAGLLHDVGKACRACNITIAHRAMHVFLTRLLPGPYRKVIGRESGPGWTKELRLLAHHPRRGAEAARMAGYDPEIVRLVADHEQVPGPADTRLALLREADTLAGLEHDR
jgi:hypothetical protein